jgi:hypothetical protein
MRGLGGLRFVVAVLTMLAACEIVILQLYVGAIARITTLSVDLEYVRGSALIASAQAQRCGSVAEQK